MFLSIAGPAPTAKRKKRATALEDSDEYERELPLTVPQVTRGAGHNMGLSVMLFANKEEYFMPSAFYEGFKVRNIMSCMKTPITEVPFVYKGIRKYWILMDKRSLTRRNYFYSCNLKETT